MATQTATTTVELTPEQKALAAMQLEQVKRRQGFEDFAGQILLGNPLSALSGGSGGTIVPSGGTPVGNTPVTQNIPTSNVGAAINTGSVGNAVNSIGSLNNLGGQSPVTSVPNTKIPSTSSSTNGLMDNLGKLVTPGVIGGVLGGAAMGLPGIGLGSKVGDSIGNLINGGADTTAPVITPEMNTDLSNQISQATRDSMASNGTQIAADTQKGIDNLTPDQIRNSGNAPASALTGTPSYTQGQISAQRAGQTAQDGMQFLAQSYGASQDLMNAMNSGGNSGPPEWARQKMQGEVIFNNKLAPALIYAGYSPKQIQDIYMKYIGGYGNGVNNDIPELTDAMNKYMTRPGAQPVK